MVAQKPAIDGWFTTDAGDGEPHLLGSRCTTCGTYFFPRADFFCRNPACDGTTFDEVPLSNRGRVWSWTVNRYQPPAPFVAPSDPYQPFVLVAVELDGDGLVVLGQAVAGLSVTDLQKSKRFYETALASLGYRLAFGKEGAFWAFDIDDGHRRTQAWLDGHRQR